MPYTDSPAHRALYMSRLLEYIGPIVAAAHDDGPDELARHVDRALACSHPPGVNPAHAVVAILAAGWNPDRTVEQHLRWLRTPKPSVLARRQLSSGVAS